MPQMDTSCPADGSARAAVQRPVALGQHQNVVYIYNEVPLNTTIAYGRLKRYDVTTGQKREIVMSGLAIQQAQVSADGQWVLFLSIPDPRGDRQRSALLQLVRVDGQGLQTLYCFPKASYSSYGTQENLPISIQWSVDQKHILFSTDINNTTSTVSLLDLSSGKITTLFTANDALYSYRVLTWLDNTRAYILKEGRVGPPPPVTLYLLDVTKRPDHNLSQVLTHAIRFTNLSLDGSYDGTQLFVGSCLMVVSPFDSSISVEPAAGGQQKTIYHHTPDICIDTMRVISSTTLLLLVEQEQNNLSSESYQVWTMNTSGADQKVLFNRLKPQGQSEQFNLNTFNQFPWSNVSRDNSLYTLQSQNYDTKVQTLYIAPLNGGAPKAFATTTTGSVHLVGWTAL